MKDRGVCRDYVLGLLAGTSEDCGAWGASSRDTGSALCRTKELPLALCGEDNLLFLFLNKIEVFILHCVTASNLKGKARALRLLTTAHSAVVACYLRASAAKGFGGVAHNAFTQK